MAETRELQLLITAKDETQAQLKNVGATLDSLQPAFKALAVGGGIAFGAISAGVMSSLSAFSDAQAETSKVNAIMNTLSDSVGKSLGKNLQGVKDDINNVSQKMIALGFDDEDTATSLARLTQSTGDYKQALDLHNMAMDLARYKNVDLATATSALMKMNSGSMRELKMLGIEVDDTTTKQDAFRIVTERTAGQAKAYSETIKGQTDTMKVSFTNLKEAVGQALAPALTKLVEAVTPLIERFSAWAEKNPDLLAKILLIGGAVAGLAMFVGILGMALPAIIGGVSALATMFGLLLSPIGLIVLAIAGLIAIGVLLYKHWDEVKAKAMEIWNAVALFFTGIWTSITTALTEAWNGIVAFFTQVWTVISNIFKFAVALAVGLVIAGFKLMGIDIVAVINNIKLFLQSAWNFIKEVFGVFATVFSETWTAFWTEIGKILSGIWDAIKSAVSLAFTFLKDLFDKATQPLKDAWSSLWDAIGGKVTSAWDGIKNVIKGSINWILEKINWVITQANNLAQSGAKVVGLTIPSIPTIPLLAEGGIVTRPTLAMIGEAGAEAVIPLNKANGLGGINIYISGNTIAGTNGVKQLAEMVGDAISRKLQLNQRTSY
jgi:phage-related protein